MTRYTATIKHHTIARSRAVDVGDTLQAAKINATREFGDGFNDHVIEIYDTFIEGPESIYPVASRVIGAGEWS